ncbi:MAG: hypothetical protein K9N51_11845 [Candidatus Pacebacteria bacterium]|nr:hypothetical protein [Candidatus Paceibacterota bacterium]
MIVRDPRGRRNDGRTERSTVNNLDVFATCLKAAQCEIPQGVESRDLFPVIDKQYDRWMDATFYKRKNDAHVAADGYTLIRGRVNGQPVYEFYELRFLET